MDLLNEKFVFFLIETDFRWIYYSVKKREEGKERERGGGEREETKYKKKWNYRKERIQGTKTRRFKKHSI